MRAAASPFSWVVLNLRKIHTKSPVGLELQVGSGTGFHAYGVRQVQHEAVINLAVVLTASRFPWKAAVYCTCNSEEKNDESVFVFCAAEMSASDCSGPALCDAIADIFISHFYSL